MGTDDTASLSIDLEGLAPHIAQVRIRDLKISKKQLFLKSRPRIKRERRQKWISRTGGDGEGRTGEERRQKRINRTEGDGENWAGKERGQKRISRTGGDGEDRAEQDKRTGNERIAASQRKTRTPRS